MIKKLKEDIKKLVSEIKRLQEEIIRLEGEVVRIKQEIENLKQQISHAILNPDELKRNLENYFSGWLRYLAGANVSDDLKNKCREVFLGYRDGVNQSVNPINN
jgi:uncharacterized coiled-coil DUF342 family protein